MDPQRRAPRMPRYLTVEAAGGWFGEVADLSAVGLRVCCQEPFEPSCRLSMVLRLENAQPIPVVARVVWVRRRDEENAVTPQMGLEIVEADRRFYEALPRIGADR